jgi:cyclopropane fatty-acyl-phospholipid synthase-like methyltransferase
MQREWWIDETAFAGAEHLDADYVAAYDRKAGYDPAEDVETMARHGLDTESTLLDLGAGTGKLAVAAASRCKHVTAVDVSPAMVAAIRDRAEAAGVENLSIEHAGFLSYEPAGGPFDVIYSRNALHQLPDFWKGIALDRVRTFLRPAGVLHLRDLVYDFQPSEADMAIEEWMSGAVSDPAIGYTPSDLAEHVRLEFGTYSWLLEELLSRTGFEVVERDIVRGVYATYTCRRKR